MLHGLPSQGYQNHAFFNYHPGFFLDLAAANDYDILGLFSNLGEDLFPYTDTVLAERGIRATDSLAIFAVLRKTTDRPFVIPLYGPYFVEERDGTFVPRTDVGSQSRVEENRFPLSSDPAPSLPSLAEAREPRVRYVIPVWGKDYVEAFLTFGLRGMIESGALAAAPRDRSEFLIVTDPPGAERIGRAEMTQRLSALTRVRILTTPTSPNAASHDLLTERHNLALADAVAGDIYFFMTSDCFVSTEVFARSLELLKTKHVVLVPSLRVVEESFNVEILRRPTLKFSGRELLKIALRHEHPLVHASCIDNERGINHPMQGQVLARVPGGYVGRWGVMHPLAIRITNPRAKIFQTVDWNYAVLQTTGWSDIAVLNTIDDGLTVTTTPLGFPEAPPFRIGSSRQHLVACMIEWVNYPWVLEFHLAQAEQPIRLLSDPSVPEPVVAAAEAKVEKVMNQFFAYVNTRRNFQRARFCDAPAWALLLKAIDRVDRVRQFQFRLAWLRFLLSRRAKRLTKYVVARLR